MRLKTLSIMGVIGIFAMAFCVGACNSASSTKESKEINLVIDHYKTPCWGMEKYLCLRADYGDGFENFHDYIEGFEFEWGYKYELKVLETEVEPVPDGSDVEYDLIEVVSKTPSAPGTTFEMPIEPGENQELSIGEEDGGILIDDTNFTCETSQVCDDLESALQTEDEFALVFGYNAIEGVFYLVVEEVFLHD